MLRGRGFQTASLSTAGSFIQIEAEMPWQQELGFSAELGGKNEARARVCNGGWEMWF